MGHTSPDISSPFFQAFEQEVSCKQVIHLSARAWRRGLTPQPRAHRSMPEVLQVGSPHIVAEFYHPTCPDCQRFAPIYERFALSLRNMSRHVLVVKVDCQSDELLCNAMRIKDYPTIRLYTRHHLQREFDLSQPANATVPRSTEIPERKSGSLLRWVNARLGLNVRLVSTSAFNKALDRATTTSSLIQKRESVKLKRTYHSIISSTNEWDAKRAAALAIVSMFHTWPISSAEREAALAFLSALRMGLPDICSSSLTAIASVVNQAASRHSELDWSDIERATPRGLCETGWSQFSQDWESCKGTWPHTRGYSCGLWTLFHTVVGRTRGKAAGAALVAIRGFVAHFFKCTRCRRHFVAAASGREFDKIVQSGGRDAVLWLWGVHNQVNKRVGQAERGDMYSFSGDPAFPKQKWPSTELCPECHSDDDQFDRDAVFMFLKKFYAGRWRSPRTREVREPRKILAKLVHPPLQPTGRVSHASRRPHRRSPNKAKGKGSGAEETEAWLYGIGLAVVAGVLRLLWAPLAAIDRKTHRN